MKKVLIALALMAVVYGHAQSFTAWINHLSNAAVSLRQTKVDSFFAANNQYPLLEYDTVAHFILKGSYSSVFLAGDMNSWQPSEALFNMGGTDLWFLTKTYPSHARLDYKFVANNNWILDPRNPNTVSGGFGPNSELAMPLYVQPWEIEDRAGILKGQVSTYNIPSAAVGASYQVQVYLPPNYNSSSSYPTAYFHDGQEYLSLGSARHVLDNLIDSNLIEPLIGVFVRPNNRNDEYAFALKDNYTQFFVSELVPWVDAQFATRQDSSKRATIGASFGGHISAWIVTHHPEVFGQHGQHSGAWWPNNYQVLNLIAQDIHQVQMPMAAVWGSFEGNLTNMWQLVSDTMQWYGYPNKYFQEYPEGHSWGLWRATLDEILIALFPAQSIGIEENIGRSPFSVRVYPNPVSDRLFIETGESPCGLTYQVIDILGRVQIFGTLEGKSINTQTLLAGTYTLVLSNENGKQFFRFIRN